MSERMSEFRRNARIQPWVQRKVETSERRASFVGDSIGIEGNGVMNGLRMWGCEGKKEIVVGDGGSV